MGLIEKFQQDLRDGMTLENALIKHNLTLKEAVEFCPKPLSKNGYKKRKKRMKVYKHVDTFISQKKDAFHVRKQIHSKTYWGGSYDSVEDARKVRDFLERNGWNPVKVNEACKKYGIKRRRK